MTLPVRTIRPLPRPLGGTASCTTRNKVGPLTRPPGGSGSRTTRKTKTVTTAATAD